MTLSDKHGIKLPTMGQLRKLRDAEADKEFWRQVKRLKAVEQAYLKLRKPQQ